ncbi:MAG: hypothetical protein IKH86_07250 [Prevotella sp.]|nr:hypothetical protein [Prevotella sp.]
MKTYIVPVTKFVTFYEKGHLLNISEVNATTGEDKTDTGISYGGGGDGTGNSEPAANEVNVWDDVNGPSVWED